ncbi:ABC transporter permease [Gimibacter soli]|uniref:FtsX-like permease family protein n=1 Tax=Gimibacter soli TaxID=3024400 RepID=A0AAE9XUN8_9PROT|nr:FtsX-like permease family protein [Gimibacter soli]WCL54905.1 FtsX-like permease family protein [Gimibacter soli]
MISRHTGLPVSLRFALRELRGGVRGFRIFAACLTLGVAVIAAVGSLTKAIEDGMAREGQTILGGDLEVRIFQQEASPEFINWAGTQGSLSRSARLRTMARSEAGEATLIELRAVDTLYPLYGRLETTPQLETPTITERHGDVWGIAVDPLVADRLGVKLGDRLRIGNLTADIRAMITREPDKANLGFQLGPSVIISHEALMSSGLVVPGSLIDHFYKLRVAPATDLKALRDEIKDEFETDGWRIIDRTTSAPGLRRFVDQMGMFLTLVGLSALVVGGVGVGNAVKGYMDQKTRTIATFKILGAEGGLIFATYLWQIMLIAAGAIAIGLVVGAMLPGVLANFLPESLPVKPDAGVFAAPLLTAGLYGFLITAAFTAWPLGQARDLPAVRLFRALVAPDRKRPRLVYVLMIALAGVGIAALAVGFAGNKTMAAGFAAACLVAFALLLGLAKLVEKLAANSPRPRKALLRLAIANLHRPGAATSAVILSMGLGLTLFASLSLIEGNLTKQLQDEVPSEAPAFFMLDIQSHERDAFEAAAKGVPGVEDVMLVPNLRGKVVSLNGVPAEEAVIDPEFKWILRGDRGLSYGDSLPDTSTLVEGDWWPDGYSGEPEVSLGREEAIGLGLKIGDTITINIMGRDITAKVRSLRQIDWGTFGFNFVILFDPYTLKAAPHTYMATLKAATDAEELAHRTLTRAYPGVTAIRMKEVLGTVNAMLKDIGLAIRVTAVVAIVAGILVLAGAIAAGFRQRVYESVILKMVGAVRRQVLMAYLMEYLLLGLLTATIALGLGSIAGWLVVTSVWDMKFQLLWTPVLGTLAAGLVVTIGLGLISSSRALAVPPNRVLRDE